MKPVKSLLGAVGALTFTSIVINAVLLAALAVPVMALWNTALVSAIECHAIGYFQTFGLLLLWQLLRIAGEGVTISAQMRNGRDPGQS